MASEMDDNTFTALREGVQRFTECMKFINLIHTNYVYFLMLVDRHCCCAAPIQNAHANVLPMINLAHVDSLMQLMNVTFTMAGLKTYTQLAKKLPNLPHPET